uniref:peptidylprolyl isomerase n=1 Tax=Anthurium amnicola TaxID=1678845 RepID=A0A1D1ZF84_9ARAE
MAFWGLEVKPGKPYTHIHDGSRGALRLSQATLGDGTATKRSVLQCNVGNKSPVLLCSLLPDRAESCCLDLQFEESEEVIFSVVGPRSVHVAGYFIGGSNRRSSGDANDSDSYGEDIWATGSEDSGSYGSEDEYESDFIDDGDIEVSPSHRRSGVVIEEIEDEKPVKGNFSHRHVKKKHQVSDSDEGDVSPQHQFVKHSKSPALESEEADGFPISFSMGKKNKEKKVGVDGKLDDKTLNVDRKRKLDVVVQDKGSKREDKVDAFGSEKSKKKKKDKVKSVKSLGTDANIPGEKIKDLPCQDQSKCADDKKYEVQPCEEEIEKANQEGLAQEMVMAESNRKLKKRKKERVRRGETHETGDLLTEDKVEEGATTAKIETTDNSEQVNIVDNDNDLLSKSGHRGVSDEMETSSSSDKWKRKKKKAKGVGTFDQEKRSAETLGKEGNDKGQSVEIIVTELSKSQEKMDHNRPVGLSFEMTTDINGESVPADKHLKHNKKKHHKKSR